MDTLLESELFGHEKGSFTGATGLKPGKFELAEDGTVFLDEIGDMSLMLQAKLLRVLQEREFERGAARGAASRSARVIAASHRNLAEEVQSGPPPRGPLPAPQGHHPGASPLRERREDIPPLVHHLLERINEKVHKRVTRVPPEVLAHHLPALARQRARAGERAHPRRGARPRRGAARRPPARSGAQPRERPAQGGGGAPQPPLSPRPAVDDASLIPTLDEAERLLIERAMAVTRGHKGKTCQILGISRPTLERKLQKYAGAQVHSFPGQGRFVRRVARRIAAGS